MSALASPLLDALRPRGVAERVRHVLAKGWTAAQVRARLPSGLQDGCTAEAVHAALLDLVREGRVRTRRVRYSVVLNTKGQRDMIVDVFWLA